MHTHAQLLWYKPANTYTRPSLTMLECQLMQAHTVWVSPRDTSQWMPSVNTRSALVKQANTHTHTHTLCNTRLPVRTHAQLSWYWKQTNPGTQPALTVQGNRWQFHTLWHTLSSHNISKLTNAHTRSAKQSIQIHTHTQLLQYTPNHAHTHTQLSQY